MTATIHAFRTGQAIQRDRIAMRDEVLERDGCRCSFCRAPDGAAVSYDHHRAQSFYVTLETLEAFDAKTGELMGEVPEDALPIGRSSRILLDLAFLDHDPSNIGRKGRRPNVVVLCQRCARRHADNAAAFRWGSWKPRKA